MKHTNITWHDVFEAARSVRDSLPISAKSDVDHDARVAALSELAHAWEAYQREAESLKRRADSIVRDLDSRGLAAAGGYDHAFATPTIQAMVDAANRIKAYREILARGCRPKDDPRSDAIDQLIRSLDPNNNDDEER